MASPHRGNKSTWKWGGPAALPEAGAPQSPIVVASMGAGTPSAVFMSSFFHIELHLMDRNTQPCQVAARAHIWRVCKPLAGRSLSVQVSGCMAIAGMGKGRGMEEPYARYCLVTSQLCPQGLKRTLNKAYLVPMQLTFKMSDVMVFRGISRGSCMWTSCSSARIQGKS